VRSTRLVGLTDPDSKLDHCDAILSLFGLGACRARCFVFQ